MFRPTKEEREQWRAMTAKWQGETKEIIYRLLDEIEWGEAERDVLAKELAYRTGDTQKYWIRFAANAILMRKGRENEQR
jgi:hypothetical protein